MNILILNWRDPKNPNAGGAEIVTHEYAKAWTKAGHQVTLFTAFFQGAKRKETIDEVTIIREGQSVFGVQFAAFRWYVFKKHEKFDIVIDQFHGIPFFTPLYVKEKKLAFIHEVTKNVWKLNPWPRPFNLIPYYIGSIAEPWIFKLFYRNIPFMTVSQSTKNELIEWGIPEKNITIIYNGTTYPIANKYLTKEKTKTVIFLGALSIDKGITDALEVFAAINKQDPHCQFWIVGKSDERHRKIVTDLSNQFGIANKIKMWGYVSEQKKFELLQKAHILLNPSEREGWGLVIIEAASQLTPSVVYDVPGLRDSVKNGMTGIVIKQKDPEETATAIMALINDEKKYKKFQEACQKWAQQFTWKRATKQALTLLSNI